MTEPSLRKKRVSPRVLLLVGLFLVWLSWFLAQEVGTGYRLARESTGWPVAEGRILESRVVRGAKGRKRARIHYRYRVGDHTYQGERVQFMMDVLDNRASEQVARWTPGSTAEVRYDPEHPARSVLAPGFTADQLWGSVSMLALLFVGGVFTTGWNARKLWVQGASCRGGGESA